MDTSASQSTLGTSQLDSTINLLLGGLPAAAGSASQTVADWLNTLRDNAEFSDISAELKTLHEALRDGAPDTSALAASLKTLGAHTTQAAATATPDAQAKLRELGQALTAAAGQVQG